MAILSTPYSPQEEAGYCFPACVQMSLAHLDIFYSQKRLASRLGVIPGYGVPASNIHNLRSRSIQTIYETEGSLSDLKGWLEQSIPVIASVQTSELEYWQYQEAQHAVLVIGLENNAIQLLDPGQSSAIISISVNEFLLAWDEMGFTYAVVYKPT